MHAPLTHEGLHDRRHLNAGVQLLIKALMCGFAVGTALAIVGGFFWAVNTVGNFIASHLVG